MRVGLGSQTHFLILRDFFNMEPWGRRYGDRRRRRAQPSSFWVFLEAAKQRKGGYMLTLSTHKTHWFSLPSIPFRSSATEGGRLTTRAGRGAPRIGSPEGARAVAKSYEWTGSPPRVFDLGHHSDYNKTYSKITGAWGSSRNHEWQCWFLAAWKVQMWIAFHKAPTCL